MEQIEFEWKNAQGQKIFAKEWRPAGEPAAVVALVHGLGEHIGRYQHVAEKLTGMGIGLVGFDIPGHGRSQGTRGHTSYDEVLLDIDTILVEAERRYPGKPRFIYGHSMGGALTLYYLLKCKPMLNGAIVTSPGLAVGEKVPASKVFAAKVLAGIIPSFTMENGLDLGNLSRDPKIAQEYKADPLVHPRVSARLGLDLLTRGKWIQGHAAEFTVPMLLMQGSGDHIVSPQATAALAEVISAGVVTYKVWEGFYHETHNEPEKDQVLDYLTSWLVQHIP